MNHSGKNYEEMTVEELRREFRAAFLETDILDDALEDELETILDVLDRKDPVEYPYTPEESWARFLEDRGEELGELLAPAPKQKAPGRAKRPRAMLRRVLSAAVIVVLLTGAALAADSLGLLAWVPLWNAQTGRYEPVALEDAAGRPIPAALRELGIAEPLYPSWLPEGFVLAESHISEDPLIFIEQYVRGDQRLSITVTPILGFKNTVYSWDQAVMWEYSSGDTVHYLFSNDGSLSAVRYTENYAVTISGDIPRKELKGIMDSLGDTSEGGKDA